MQLPQTKQERHMAVDTHPADIRQAVDIHQVVGQVVDIRRAGRSRLAVHYKDRLVVVAVRVEYTPHHIDLADWGPGPD